jgi:LacI family transcriptional regulator
MASNLRDIANMVGLSVTTVSRALNGHDDVAEKTRQRIIAAAKELDYAPNLMARRLRKQRTDMLGFILPTFGPRFSDPFFSEFIAGIGDEAAKHEFDLVVSTHPPESEGERGAYLRAIHGSWVDGVIVVRTRWRDSRIAFLKTHGFPFVAFGRCGEDATVPYVDEDSIAGISMLTQHFIDLGHRAIGFIAAPSNLMFGRYRLQGFTETMERNGLAVETIQIAEGDLTETGGATAATRLLASFPQLTAIIASNDLMAIGAMKSIRKAGRRPGVDVAIGGFDDIPAAAYAGVPLTTVRQPIYEIGCKTCAMLIDIIASGPLAHRQILLKPELVVRASSGSPLVTGSSPVSAQ